MTTQKFSKFIRPEAGRSGPITDRDLDILDAVLRYRFSAAAQIARLAGGNEDVTHRRFRRLWERGLLTRWAFPGVRTHSEFYYYLDSREPLDLLAERRRLDVHSKCSKRFAATVRGIMPARRCVASTCNSGS
jgi:hypothetical protein